MSSFDRTPTQVHQTLTKGGTWLNTPRPMRPEDLVGRIILLDFWSFCCINCMHVLPDLQTLESEFGSELTVIGVHSGKFPHEKDDEAIRQAVIRYDIQHAVVNDPEFLIWVTFRVTAWPTMVLINAKGEIVRIYSGEGHLEEMRADINQARLEAAGNHRTDALPIYLEKNKLSPSLLRYPSKLAWADDLNVLFVSDSNNHRILGIDASGRISIIIGDGKEGWEDGPFAKARFSRPQGLCYRDRTVWIADTENHVIRKVDLKTSTVQTIAGTGVQGFERLLNKAQALFTAISSPWDLTIDETGEGLLIAMAGTHQLWRYDFKTQTLSAIAGNGREEMADGVFPENSLSQPSGITRIENKIYFVDAETSSLRVMEGGRVRTLIGKGLFDFGHKDGNRALALMQHPLGIYAEKSGVFIADTYNHCIRFFDPESGVLKTISGTGKPGHQDGAFDQATFNEPSGIIKVGKNLLVTDTNNHTIRVLNLLTGQVDTLIPYMPKDFISSRPKDSLPQTRAFEKALVRNDVPIKVKLILSVGFKLSEEAPSWLAVYRIDGKDPVIVKQFDLSSLLPRVVELDPISTGSRYLLQGTLYFCKDGMESKCFLQSHNQVLEGSSTGVSVITIPLSTEWTGPTTNDGSSYY